MNLRELVRVLQGKTVSQAAYYEPRLWWDGFTFTGTQQTVHNGADTYRNSEKRVIRIHTIVATTIPFGDEQQTPPGSDERIVQRYGMRIFVHGDYYQNADFVALPLWGNVPVAAADPVTTAIATWKFANPVILGRRGSFDVRVSEPFTDVDIENHVAVAFDGVGLFSRQPKRIVGEVDLPGTGVEQAISADSYVNDGVEPMEIHSVTIFQRPPVTDANPVGNVHNLNVRIRMTDDMTTQWWVTGPTVPTSAPRAPGPLWGPTVGRGVVHRIPGDGWRFDQGEGVEIEIQSEETTRSDIIAVGLLGEVLIT